MVAWPSGQEAPFFRWRKLGCRFKSRSGFLLFILTADPVSFATFLRKRISSLFYCLFARDVTAAMLVVKNKSISFLWELNYRDDCFWQIFTFYLIFISMGIFVLKITRKRDTSTITSLNRLQFDTAPFNKYRIRPESLAATKDNRIRKVAVRLALKLYV